MGACIQARNYPSLEVAKKEWRDDQNSAACEDGNSYSGNINMLPAELPDTPDVTLGEGESVWDHLEEHDKYERAMVIQLPDGSVVVGGWCSS